LEGVVLTGDPVIYDNMQISGNTDHIRWQEKRRQTTIEEFFDSETMSLHLKEGSYPVAKRVDRVTGAM